MIGRLVLVLALALAAMLVAGLLGALHPGGDTAAVFRLYLALPLAVCAGILHASGWRRSGAGMVFAALVALAPLVPLHGQASAVGGAHLSLYQKNMMFRMPDPQALAADILARAPDFITLQEVSGANLAALAALAEAYPSQHFCPFATVGGVAVASRWPMIEGSAHCAEHDGLAAMRVKTPAGPVWLVSVHLHWPWPYSQASHAARLEPVLAALDGPKVIGGERLTDTRIVGRPHVTLVKRGWLRVPIDHVLVTGGQGTTERLPLVGSDHYGVLARFSLAP
jgi:endonuclease/exonuclease/phosphatase (EEP) superfamily protein YafD